jgi:hypothetical protein
LATLAVALAAMGVLVAGAFALVTVYKNAFNNAASFKEVSRSGGGGGSCAREFRKKDGEMRVTVKEGPVTCEYQPPVEGDGPRPDHNFQAHAVVGRQTDKDVDETAFVAVAVRVGGGSHYQLRVFPKTDTYKLRRQPSGAGFPAQGTEATIKPIGRVNQIEIAAVGNEVRAFANDVPLATVVDANPGELDGASVEFGVGNEADTGKDTFGSITRIELRVPDP